MLDFCAAHHIDEFIVIIKSLKIVYILSRMERRTMALFRSGALPIAIETSRYSRTSTPVDSTLFDLCDMGVVESEKHFLLDCPLYSDLRYDLYYECSKYIDNF
jgi:hypothetical protein